MLGAGHASTFEFLLDPPEARLQLSPRADTALGGGPGAELAPSRPGGEVGVRGFGRGPLDRTFDADLPLLQVPIKGEGGPRVGVELGRLSALVIGEEREAIFAGALEQDEAQAGLAPSAGGGEAHRLGLLDARPLCLGEPLLEQGQGLRGRALEAHLPLDSGAARPTQCREFGPKPEVKR